MVPYCYEKWLTHAGEVGVNLSTLVLFVKIDPRHMNIQ